MVLKSSTTTTIAVIHCCSAFLIMIQIFALMAFLGGFSFIGFGICVANSIEAEKSEKTSNIMTVLSVTGMLSFIIGLIGLAVMS